MTEEAKPKIEEEQEWNVQDYEKAMAHLEALQDQITALRATIPSIIRPLTRPNTTQSEAFNNLKKSAVCAVRDLSNFRTQWESEKTQNMLKSTRESRVKDGDLSLGREIPVYGWVVEGEGIDDDKDLDIVKTETVV